MNELDDRLAGDEVWELFPARAGSPARESRSAQVARWLVWAFAVVAIWLLSPPVAIVMAGLVISAGDFRHARHLARSIPDKAGGAICALFGCAWGVWKFAMTALAFLIAIDISGGIQPEMSSAFVTSLLVALCGHVLSAMLTAAGLIGAYRSGMRVWVGEGVNRARLLLLAMLLVMFTFAVIGPVSFWLAMSPKPSGVGPLNDVVLAVLGMSVGGAFVLLLMLDWLSARVVADRPARFGAKVPAVGKWDSYSRETDTLRIARVP
jgi:hypothetical protein